MRSPEPSVPEQIPPSNGVAREPEPDGEPGLAQRVRTFFGQQFRSLYTWAHLALVAAAYLWPGVPVPSHRVFWFETFFAVLGLLAAHLRRRAVSGDGGSEQPTAGYSFLMATTFACHCWLTVGIAFPAFYYEGAFVVPLSNVYGLAAMLTLASATAWMCARSSVKAAWFLSLTSIPWLQPSAQVLYGSAVVIGGGWSVYWTYSSYELGSPTGGVTTTVSAMALIPVLGGLLAIMTRKSALEQGWGSIRSQGTQIAPWFALLTPGIVLTEGGAAWFVPVGIDHLAFEPTSILWAIWLIATLVVLFGIDTAAGRLRQPLPTPEPPPDDTRRVRFSVQPDPSTYYDHQHYAENLDEFIELSGTGGVLGITGVRGAGKSALLARVAAGLKERYCVLEMPAPARHEEGMAFFITVCRNLCTRVLEETERVLTGDLTPERRAVAEALGRARWLLLGAIVLAGVFLYFKAHPSTETDESVQALSTRVAVSNGTDSLLRGHVARVGGISQVAAHVLASERTVVKDLLQQVTGLLDGAPKGDAPAGERTQHYVLQVQSAGIGFVLRPQVGTPEDPLEQIHPGIRELSSSSFVERALEVLKRGVQHPIALEELREGQQPERSMLQAFAYSYHVLDSRVVDGYQRLSLQGNYEFDAVRNSAVVLMGMEFLGRRTAFANAVRLQSQQLRRLVRNEPPEDPFRRPTFSLPGWTLLEASLESGPILLSHRDLGILQPVLQRFGEILQAGPTANPDRFRGPSGGSDSGGGMLAIVQTLRLAPAEVTGIVVVLLLLVLGGFLWNFVNFGVRALVNPGALGLLRDSEAFLQLLSYREEKERSLGFNLRGLTAGRRQRLLAREMSLPGLTSRFAAYTERIRRQYNGKVVIAIDELDKITDVEEVKKLLTEVKGALAVGGCFYLMTISEDAAQSFRDRFGGGRDIFESSFDEMYQVSRLNKQAVHNMTALWLEGYSGPGLTDQNKQLLLLFGGGLAREIVRYFRAVYLDKELPLDSPPVALAKKFLAAEIDEWLGQAALRVPGETATNLYAAAQECVEIVQRAELGKPEFVRIEELINRSIELLDPSGRRATVATDGVLPGASGSDKDGFLSLLPAIRTCIRIRIMVALMRWVKAGDPRLESEEERIIECFRVLPAQTTVAERLFAEISGGRSSDSRPIIIGNRRTKIYHLPGSPSYSRVSAENRVAFTSPEMAEAQGYRQADNRH